MAEDLRSVWVATESDADAAARTIRLADTAGYDSEFDGVDLSVESCVGKSRIDVFSIAVSTERLSPLGFYWPRSWVFDGRLITYGPIKEYLEDARYTKVVHNLPVDSHTARNAGVEIKGGLNTLSLARWVYPWRANLLRGNFDLDSLCKWRVGFGKTEDFDDFLRYDDYEEYTEMVERKVCIACDDPSCRKKKAPHDAREPRIVEAVRRRKVRRTYDLRGIRPGNPLFKRYLAYAASDAELAFIIYQMMLIDGKAERPYPYGL